MPTSSPRRTGLTSTRSPIPVELLTRIISHLDASQLARCASASWQINLIATPYLYRYLHIDLSKPTNPLFISNRPIRGRREGSARKAETAHGASQSRSLPEGSLADRFAYTRHLTLVPTWHLMLPDIVPLSMPRLQSLHIGPLARADVSHTTPCECVYPNTDATCGPNHLPHCGLLKHLRPSQLIIHNTFHGINGLRVFGPTHTLPSFITHLVVIVNPIQHISSQKSFFHSIPCTVKRLTLVIPRWRRGETVRDDDPSWVGWGGEVGLYVRERTAKAIGEALSGKAERLEVVGYDGVRVRWADVDIARDMETVREVLEESLVERGWSLAEAEKKARGVVSWKGTDYIREASGEAMALLREMVREVVVKDRVLVR